MVYVCISCSARWLKLFGVEQSVMICNCKRTPENGMFVSRPYFFLNSSRSYLLHPTSLSHDLITLRLPEPNIPRPRCKGVAHNSPGTEPSHTTTGFFSKCITFIQKIINVEKCVKRLTVLICQCFRNVKSL